MGGQEAARQWGRAGEQSGRGRGEQKAESRDQPGRGKGGGGRAEIIQVGEERRVGE